MDHHRQPVFADTADNTTEAAVIPVSRTIIHKVYTSTTPATFLAVVLLALASNVIWTWYRLRHIPGPLWACWSKYWQIKTQFQGNWYLELKKVGDQYGELFRVGPNQLMTTDVDVVRRMAYTKSAYTRGPFYQTFRYLPNQDHSFSLLDDAEHTRRRTLLGPGYAGGAHLESCVDRQCARLVDLIERKFISTPTEYRPIDMTLISSLFTMDCIGDLSFGGDFGGLDEGVDIYNFIKWNEEFFVTAVVVSNYHWLIKIASKPFFNRVYPTVNDKEGIGKFIPIAIRAVEERLAKDGEGRKDALSLFIDHGVNKQDAINELLVQLVAGADPVAAAIRMTLLFLTSNPKSYDKLKAEIDDAVTKGAVSSPIKDAEARQLPYLQAVIKEGVRTFPVVTATLFKKVPKGGDVINGYFVPEGTEVGHNVLGIMRSPKYWGDDADVFRPERWIEADKKTFDMMSGVLETLWGSGRFKCLGRVVASMEMNKVFVELLRRFDFSVAKPHDSVKILNPGFFLMSEMNMRVTKRDDFVSQGVEGENEEQ
ncbi:cytochrome P450 [Biscogniauxia marginata]|nr:cytochrome P450 [Biscogniauxia marginata]